MSIRSLRLGEERSRTRRLKAESMPVANVLELLDRYVIVEFHFAWANPAKRATGSEVITLRAVGSKNEFHRHESYQTACLLVLAFAGAFV